MSLIKADIVKDVANLGFPKDQSTRAVETLLETIKGTLKNGEDVLISGFGKFCVKEKKDRRGRSPQTGEDLTPGARRIVTFKCSGVLQARVNGKGD